MFVTVNELVGLPGLPTTQQGLRYSLKKIACNSPELVRKRSGSKAFEYHIDCLPAQAREIIKERHYREILQQNSDDSGLSAQRVISTTRDELELLRQCPALLEREVDSLTEKQKEIADARATLAMEVEKLRDAGITRTAAVNYVSLESRKGTLPAHLLKAAELANARKGSNRAGVGTRALQEWLTIFESTKPGVERMAMLAPGHLKAKKPEQIKWLPDFLAHWRNRKGPNLREAYRSFEAEWAIVYADQPAMAAACPSYDSVRRAMDKLPRREKARGRVSGSAALAYECFQKRDWSQMPVNGCWIADGKSLEMKVAHPDHGRPFTPELTLIIDGRTRFVTGWSLALSESVIAVADAYRYAMRHFGNLLLPQVSYSPGEPLLDASLRSEATMFQSLDANADLAEGGVTPFYARSLIADWERVLELAPSETATYQQRQQRVLAKLSEVGGLSIPYFIQLAASLGYTITIDEPQPFRAGVNRAGDRLWVESIIWVWRINVQNSGTQVYRFRAGSSAAGERLTSFGDPVIEEVFRDLKPAHTFCYFAYKENE